jgi:hypothetical protein
MTRNPLRISYRQWRAAVSYSFLICSSVMHGQATTPQSDAQDKASLFISRAFTQCGDSYFVGPLDRPILSCLDLSEPGRGPIQSCREVMEAGKVGSHAFTLETGAPLTQAQQMNGMEWQGFIKFTYPVFRIRMQENGVWRRWSEWNDQRIAPIVAALVKQNGQWFVKDMRDNGYGMTNMLEDRLQRKNGASLSSDDQMLFSGGEFVPLDKLLQTLPKLSCEDVVNPDIHAAARPTPAVENVQKFNGTIDEFTAAFPGLVQQKAAGWRLNPHLYDKEVKYIIDLVRKCGQIPPEVLRNATYFSQDGKHASVNSLKLGGQYQICHANLINASGANPNFHFYENPSMRVGWNAIDRYEKDHSWKNPLPLSLQIAFVTADDGLRNGYLGSTPDSLIVDATIQ